MVKTTKITLLIAFCAFAGNILSQNKQTDFEYLEQSLNKKAYAILESEENKERLERNNEFYNLFLKTLSRKESFDYHFSSLEIISELRSPNDKFRIITWHVPLMNGNYKFFGFFQVKDDTTNTYNIYELIDNTNFCDNSDFKNYNHGNWYGAYYYDLIHEQYKDKDYYTLLGWKGKDALINKRIIEPLTIDVNGKPVFGQKIFKYKDNSHRRVILRHSAKISMSLNYDGFFTNKNAETDSALINSRQNAIIFERVEPRNEYLEGHYQFYKPLSSIFDAFVFENGKWVLHEDVDTRNP